MSNWIATNELRFVKRGRYEDAETALQQKWVMDFDNDDVEPYEEWIDVPIVEEE